MNNLDEVAKLRDRYKTLNTLLNDLQIRSKQSGIESITVKFAGYSGTYDVTDRYLIKKLEPVLVDELAYKVDELYTKLRAIEELVGKHFMDEWRKDTVLQAIVDKHNEQQQDEVSKSLSTGGYVINPVVVTSSEDKALKQFVERIEAAQHKEDNNGSNQV